MQSPRVAGSFYGYCKERQRKAFELKAYELYARVFTPRRRTRPLRKDLRRRRRRDQEDHRLPHTHPLRRNWFLRRMVSRSLPRN